MSINNKNLLIITNGFPSEEWQSNHTFVKSQVDEIKDNFNKIYVISQTPYFPKALSKLTFLPKLYRNYALPKNYTYDNVEVFFPRYFTFPEGIFTKFRGDQCYGSILKCIRDNNISYDLIHAHFTWPSGYVAVKLKEKHEKKVILTTHGLHKTRLKKFISTYDSLNTWKNTDVIVNVSNQCLKLLSDLGLDQKKLVYLPNIVDLRKYLPITNAKEILHIPKNKKVIVSVGNLVEKKGHEYLIRALNEMRNIRTDFICYIVGGGHLEVQLNKLIHELNLEKYIILVGPKPHDEVPLWMNIADVFVLNSFVENFGVVNIEALACGIPVISTINGGSEDIITSENLGFLTKDPRNYQELSLKINSALETTWNRDKLINHSKKYASDKIMSELSTLYESVIN